MHGKNNHRQSLSRQTQRSVHYLTDYAKTNNLTVGEDPKRKTLIINEEKMQQKLAETISETDNANIIIDGHYASAVTPRQHTALVFVLRRNPVELKQFMMKCGYEGSKLWENLAAEILDVVLGEAVEVHAGRVCELDVTGKSVEAVVAEILDVLEKRKTCFVGTVDWLGMLEREGLTDQYLKTE